jgi:hypothetical protein
MFLPWAALAIPKLKNTVATTWKENPQFFAFVFLWGLAIVGMGALTSKFYERYLLPVAPVLAVWLAWMLIRGGGLDRAKGLKIVAAILYSLVAFLVGVNAWFLGTGSGDGWSYVYLALGILFLGYGVWALLRSSVLPSKLLAISVLMLFFLVTGITRLISLPHQGSQVATVVVEMGVDAPIGFAGSLHEGSKIRMSLGPAYAVVDLSREGWREEAKDFTYLILEERRLAEWDTSGYAVHVASTHLDSDAIPAFIQASSLAEREKLLVKQGITYFLLEKK